MWFLAWMPRALAEGTNPLLTDRLNAPDGVNLMWNTAVPLIALAVAPVTLLGAPILAYNVALAGAVAMSGLACFVACRRLAGGFAGPLVGGAVYALSPYMASHAALHLPLVAVWGPPLFLVLLHELLVRRRSRPAFVGAGLGLLAAGQNLTAEELLATSALTAHAGSPPRRSRRRWSLRSWRGLRSPCSSSAPSGSTQRSRTRPSSRRCCSTSWSRRRTS